MVGFVAPLSTHSYSRPCLPYVPRWEQQQPRERHAYQFPIQWAANSAAGPHAQLSRTMPSRRRRSKVSTQQRSLESMGVMKAMADSRKETVVDGGVSAMLPAANRQSSQGMIAAAQRRVYTPGSCCAAVSTDTDITVHRAVVLCMLHVHDCWCSTNNFPQPKVVDGHRERSPMPEKLGISYIYSVESNRCTKSDTNDL